VSSEWLGARLQRPRTRARWSTRRRRAPVSAGGTVAAPRPSRPSTRPTSGWSSRRVTRARRRPGRRTDSRAAATRTTCRPSTASRCARAPSAPSRSRARCRSSDSASRPSARCAGGAA